MTKEDSSAVTKKKFDELERLLTENPKISYKAINEALKAKFGSGFPGGSIAATKRELGIKTKPSHNKGKKKSAITDEDVQLIVSPEIPKDVREVMTETIAYMRVIGVQYLELHEDGTVKARFVQELETMVDA